jgi:hypothetical protein
MAFRRCSKRRRDSSGDVASASPSGRKSLIVSGAAVTGPVSRHFAVETCSVNGNLETLCGEEAMAAPTGRRMVETGGQASVSTSCEDLEPSSPPPVDSFASPPQDLFVGLSSSGVSTSCTVRRPGMGGNPPLPVVTGAVSLPEAPVSPPLLSCSHFYALHCDTSASCRMIDDSLVPVASVEPSSARVPLPRVLVSYILCFVPDCERIIACLSKDWSCDDTFKEMTCAWVGLRASTLLRNRMTDLVGLAPLSRRTSWKCLFLSLRRKANYHSAQGNWSCVAILWVYGAVALPAGTLVTAIGTFSDGFL